jgi:tetratricopeptide (TPR) repeat protein
MCTACHRAFLSSGSGNAHHLVGQDDATPWARSAYAGSLLDQVDDPIEEKSCQGCHMADEDAVLGDPAADQGRIASHRVLGGHSWLAAMRRDPAQLRRIEGFLRHSVSIDVAAVIGEDGRRTVPAEGAPVRPGERLLVDVVVRNQAVGHRFPGGTVDAQDAWIEVVVEDARGRRLAEAGTLHEVGGDDPTAHRFRALVVDDEGTPQLARETHRFHGPVYNHTLLPRDAVVIQYAFVVPARAALPLKVEAHLRHRTRLLALQAAACEEARSPRGEAFAQAARERGAAATDPCAPQPVLDLDDAAAWIGEGWGPRQERRWRDRPPRPTWRRLWEHALGLSHAVQERLHEARPSLERALAEVERQSDARPRAMVLALLARVSAGEGRTDEALAYLDRAAAALPGHPALDAQRGDALSRVWRFAEAVEPLRRASAASPRDDRAFAALGLALGASGRDREALTAARAGLLLRPRDPDLLRLQALSLRALGAPPDLAGAALEAYLECRPPDDAPRVRNLCQQKVPGCARERNPVHVHDLRPSVLRTAP